jgi:hypothetical protein
MERAATTHRCVDPRPESSHLPGENVCDRLFGFTPWRFIKRLCVHHADHLLSAVIGHPWANTSMTKQHLTAEEAKPSANRGDDGPTPIVSSQARCCVTHPTHQRAACNNTQRTRRRSDRTTPHTYTLFRQKKHTL